MNSWGQSVPAVYLVLDLGEGAKKARMGLFPRFCDNGLCALRQREWLSSPPVQGIKGVISKRAEEK